MATAIHPSRPESALWPGGCFGQSSRRSQAPVDAYGSAPRGITGGRTRPSGRERYQEINHPTELSVCHDQSPLAWLNPSARAPRRQEPVFAGAPEGIVPGNLNQAGEKPVARLARGAGELAQAVRGARARHELVVADGKRAEHQQALVVVGQGAYQVGQELPGMRVLFQATDRDRRAGAAATEHGGADEEIRKEGFAGRDRHGQQASCLTKTSVLRRRSG